ncbi:UvrD-helicase domain-containing protein [Bradyrhizobium ottawaense]|uniref:UvrD-helicase domain-containing protein n=1 Tax=Bradyrhizobium ottawaense TaxID=931866 RepID=UPI001FD994A3|nr:UvrD-helicase domain-containing protein [Bradyrhizobium ottawaense]
MVNGADPGRRLPMTFSRQAATEMADQVHVLSVSSGSNPSLLSVALAGTFHAIPCLLRKYAERIRFDPAFTIYDRKTRPTR